MRQARAAPADTFCRTGADVAVVVTDRGPAVGLVPVGLVPDGLRGTELAGAGAVQASAGWSINAYPPDAPW